MSPLPRPVLLYDDGCRFCRFAAHIVMRLDRQDELAVLPLHDAQAASLLDRLPVAERFSSWRLVQRGGSVVGYGAGAADLFAAMGLTRPLGSLVARVPAGALDCAYEAIARHRSRLGRLVPDSAAVRRFP